jgi:hypothetical protein
VPRVALGLVVEGAYDTAVFSELIPRILGGEVQISRVIETGGSGRLMARVPGYVKAMEFANAGGPVDRVIVVRDSNAKGPAKVEEGMRSKMAGRNYRFPRGVKLHAVRRETETWLLADAAAIGHVAGGRDAPETRHALEEIQDAKARLREVLSLVGLPYTPGVCAEIARALDLETLRRRCPNFRAFEEKVRE